MAIPPSTKLLGILAIYVMTTIKSRPGWVKDKILAPDFEIIHVSKWDDYKDFKTDDGCYILVRIYRDTFEIGVAICNYKHEILKEFRGRRSQDIYNAIFKYSEDKKLNWFNRLDHAAYLGKELKKAEMCLVLGCDYYQE